MYLESSGPRFVTHPSSGPKTKTATDAIRYDATILRSFLIHRLPTTARTCVLRVIVADSRGDRKRGWKDMSCYLESNFLLNLAELARDS